MTEEERAKLTPEERERLAAAEAEALEMLQRQMGEGRWYPRRHQRFVVIAIVGLAVLAFVVAVVAQAIQSWIG